MLARQLVVARLLAQPDGRGDVLDRTDDVPARRLALPDGTVESSEGRVQGSLTREPRGDNGFGYDPIFLVDGDARTLAEYTDDEKNAISHRGRAFRELAPILRKRLTE